MQKYDNDDPNVHEQTTGQRLLLWPWNSPNTAKEAIEAAERKKDCGAVTKTMPQLSLGFPGHGRPSDGEKTVVSCVVMYPETPRYRRTSHGSVGRTLEGPFRSQLRAHRDERREVPQEL